MHQRAGNQFELFTDMAIVERTQLSAFRSSKRMEAVFVNVVVASIIYLCSFLLR